KLTLWELIFVGVAIALAFAVVGFLLGGAKSAVKWAAAGIGLYLAFLALMVAVAFFSPPVPRRSPAALPPPSGRSGSGPPGGDRAGGERDPRSSALSPARA